MYMLKEKLKQLEQRSHMRSCRTDIAKDVVQRIIDDISSRQGFDHMWSRTDSDIQQEIFWEWINIVVQRLGEEDEKAENEKSSQMYPL